MTQVIRAARPAGMAALVATGSIACLVVCGVLCVADTPAQAQNPTTVAVVRDGDTAAPDIMALIKDEVAGLIENPGTVIFKESPSFNANWEGGSMREVVERALNDPEVDIVVGIGALVTQAASAPDLVLRKPFISAFVQREPLFGIGGRGEKPNLSVVLVPNGVEQDLAAFQQMMPFQRLAVVLGKELADQLDRLRNRTSLTLDGREVAIDLIPVGADVGSALNAVTEDVTVVYLARTPRLGEEQRRELIAAINARGIPTFSLVGHRDVELGALAGLMPDLGQKLARRVALNIMALIGGETTDELPVSLTAHTRLMLNGRTAAAIGYRPSVETLALAQVIDVAALESDAEPLTFDRAVELAGERNIDLIVKDANVESTLRDKQRSLSPLLPQVFVDGGYLKSRPLLDAVFFPTEITTVGVNVSQMIFDDRTISDFRSTGRVYEADRLDREVRRLDVVAAAGTAFYGYVLDRVLARVQAENVQLTADNLEMSKVRYDVGHSGQDEVFRWRAQLAQNRTLLLDAVSNLESSRIAFNQVLGVEQERKWLPRELSVDADVFPFVGGELSSVYQDSKSRAILREFMVEFAVENAPELGFFDRAIEAQSIQVGQRRRRFLIPSLQANFRYDYVLGRTPSPMDARDDQWSVSLEAAYPLFNGGDRYYDLRKQQAELAGLESEHERMRQLIERRARTAFASVENSFPTLKLTQLAAENARKNLNVVQEKYAQGIVNVTDLLEAQNQSFVSDQNAAAAIYIFLSDLLELQRSVSWFEIEKTVEERAELVRRVNELVMTSN